MPQDTLLLMVFLATVIGIFGVLFYSSKINFLIDKWAKENGYKIVSKQVKSFSMGPFSSSPKLGQRVFYVEVIDKSGNKKLAWVRCYTRWTEIFPNKIEVEWDS
ncbi:MAG: hypothetical protein IPK14_03940 [Blastocatellia bacterium]|nr:hypothetical protein [Blastocatellia bacterium]MBN8725565.1 hypothetical protein [Acidobacteriota bacterium]